jgi:hypothetical protein
MKIQCYTLSCIIGVHMDLQKIMSSYSSYYLLKYTMKCKPHDAIFIYLFFNKNTERLGLHDLLDTQLQMISSWIISKFVSLLKMTSTCLQIPIVQNSITIKYIDSKLPSLQTKIVKKSKMFGFHCIDIYINRPQ